ncbi:MAG: hypothetical protein LH632_00685, partial [Rhodoferax sp.]|nr:hypothetical protein [Rhodoferax sp.]
MRFATKEYRMEKANPPRSFGVFKPVGHTVIAFSSAGLLEAAADALLSDGFQPNDLVRYTPAEMAAQADSDLHTASPMASIGQDLNIVRAHRALAENGCSFLVVETTNSSKEQQVDEVVHAMKATAAQRFGTLIVEELVEAPDGRNQSFESPDTGLDIETD